jgi:PAS domain S-box-containing protein
VLEAGTPLLDVDITGETPRSPGETRHWRASYYPVPGEDGPPIGVAAVVVEVTGEHRARLEQQAATALLDVVFSGAPVGLGVWDTDLRYQRVNPALAKLSGLPPEAHIGRRPDELFGPIGAAVLAVLREVAEDRVAVVDREVTGRKDGIVVYRQLTVFPVLGPQGSCRASRASSATSRASTRPTRSGRCCSRRR